MHFEFTADQLELAKRVQAFAQEQVAPGAAARDQASQYEEKLLPAMAAEGLFGLRIGTEYGGTDRDAVTTGLVLEELAAGDVAVGYPVLNAALIGGVLHANANQTQKTSWLPPIAAGEAIVALCLTEPEHGTDAAHIQMTAEPDGDGWRLTGEKTSIMIGAYATHGLIFARTGDEGATGITAFYAALDDPRVTRTSMNDLGSRAARRSRLVFDGLPVGAGEVVGGPGLGFVQVMRGFDYSRALISLMALGAAGASLREAYERAGSRQAFGQPIGKFQGVSFPLAEQATLVHAARLLTYEALWRNDAGLRHRAEANMAKWWAPKVAMEAANQALITFGHEGYSEDAPLARRLRDIIGLQLADGTENATKLVVTRELLGRDSAP
ncbi:acyl-CoA dehydrogenase family protein [Fodinicola feengrottensis]|uniref:Acyl-CoA dehydrogenase family protein n=1 Tax=Fodinicola feengrottensis TaxID=435914 RepID=A0ABN2GQ93_9ACTN